MKGPAGRSGLAPPQQTAVRSMRIPQVWEPRAATEVKTPDGASSCPSAPPPQQITRPPDADTPQLWDPPAATAVNSPDGGLDCPRSSAPQQTARPPFIPHVWNPPAATAVNLPVRPSDCPCRLSPQQSTEPPPERMPQVWAHPADTDPKPPIGGAVCPTPLSPQQTALSSASTAHVWNPPAATAVNSPDGGLDCRCPPPPQQSTLPPARRAQEWDSPAATAVNPPDGGLDCPTRLSPQHDSPPPASIAQACPPPTAAAVNLSSSGAGRPSTLARKEAICPLVTGSSGQKRSGAEPQPRVTPAAASASMLRVWGWPAASTKPAGGPSSKRKARTRKAAICPLGTGSSGQYRAGRAAHPSLTPSSASRSTYGAHHSPASTSENRIGGPDGPSPLARTIHTAAVHRRTGSAGQKRPAPHPVPASTPSASRASTADP